MSASEKTTPPPNPPAPDEQTTGLPGFRSWRAVYYFVLGTFVVYLVLLAVFTHAYSR